MDDKDIINRQCSLNNLDIKNILIMFLSLTYINVMNAYKDSWTKSTI